MLAMRTLRPQNSTFSLSWCASKRNWSAGSQAHAGDQPRSPCRLPAGRRGDHDLALVFKRDHPHPTAACMAVDQCFGFGWDRSAWGPIVGQGQFAASAGWMAAANGRRSAPDPFAMIRLPSRAAQTGPASSKPQRSSALPIGITVRRVDGGPLGPRCRRLATPASACTAACRGSPCRLPCGSGADADGWYDCAASVPNAVGRLTPSSEVGLPQARAAG